VRVVRMLVVGDEVSDIAAGLRELLEAADLVVTSGGLGPTHDDRTVEAVAEVAGVPLVLDEDILAQITSWTDAYAARSGTDPARYESGNRKQAHIPQGASMLGLAGTAPGLVVALGDRRAVVLPGVPSELRRLFEDAPSHPLLGGLFGAARLRDRWLTRTYGISESRVADMFRESGGDPPGVETSICARNYEIEIDVRAEPGAEEPAAALVGRLRRSLGEHVFATDDEPLPAMVLELARRRGVSIATAESCTGGMVAAQLTSVPGSSDAFIGGAVTYSDELKRTMLGVPEQLLAAHGAVSAEVAAAMAAGARVRLGADVAVSVTGVAGPGGGSEEKPVGLVFVHVSSPWGEDGRRLQWPGGRADVRTRATVAALHLLREHLGTVPASSPT
jgi:nicotinamide-nucleotide amidase